MRHPDRLRQNGKTQMTNDANRNRFIPFRKADIVDMCGNDSRMEAGDAEEFREFCRILEALLHFEFHQNL